MSFSETPITIKDSNGTAQPIVAYTDGTNSAFAHPLLDSTGAIINPATAGNQTTANAALGNPADAAVTNPASSSSIIGALKGMLTNLGTIASSLASIAAYLAPVTGKIAMPSADTPVTAGRYFYINPTSSGNVQFTYQNGSSSIMPVTAGLPVVLRAAVTQFNAAGTSATATFENWI